MATVVAGPVDAKFDSAFLFDIGRIASPVTSNKYRSAETPFRLRYSILGKHEVRSPIQVDKLEHKQGQCGRRGYQ